MTHQDITNQHATETLRSRLFKTPDFETFIDENAELLKPQRLCDFLNELRIESGMSVMQIVKKCGIDRNYLHQILNGTRKPSRDKLIQLAFGIGLDEEMAQEMLKVAQMSQLYPRIIRDAAILRCIHDKKSFDEIQELLYRLELTPLNGEETKHG